MKLSVTKTFEFEAAHYLPHYNGACHNQHGHRFCLEVEISGSIQQEGANKGMIVDFSLLKKTVIRLIIDRLDHKSLNTIFDNPTAEEMVLWIASELRISIPEDVFLERVRLYETSSSYAEWRL